MRVWAPAPAPAPARAGAVADDAAWALNPASPDQWSSAWGGAVRRRSKRGGAFVEGRIGEVRAVVGTCLGDLKQIPLI